MFNSVQYVRDMCKDRGIAISQLEKDCGFSNGYLNPKKITRITYDRAVIVAEYLGVEVSDILDGPANKKAPTVAGERKISNADLKFALWGDAQDVDDDDLEDVRRYAAFVRERKQKK